MKMLTVMLIASVVSVNALASDRNPHDRNHANVPSRHFYRNVDRNVDTRDYTRDSARLHAASVEFAAQMRRYGEKSSLHESARKLSREAYRFHTSAISADPRSSKVQERYEELAKYYYRMERSFHTGVGYRQSRGSSLVRSYHELSRAFESLNNSYMVAQNSYRIQRDQRAYAPAPMRRQWESDRNQHRAAPGNRW